ncbi:TonB-dependent receptor [Thalassotalea sp. HSM 43]|uniref:TonB-dependent receptor n=1 Tax=Thalassotalea sp. HSM 43 TaxID=2552945 RepID=UPI0010807A06|nr:TonB-dependent receptor [Thalassotalea sp. HSM 43]QBY04524.1 TonB-dependent receptor [Thalassotalea sp. HSM 43]
MKLATAYVMHALIYVLIGVAFGLYMAANQNHSQHVTHAHLLMLGFVMSFFYACIHKLWLDGSSSKLAVSQFVLHQLGTILMVVGMGSMYGMLMHPAIAGITMGVAALLIMASIVMMIIMLKKQPQLAITAAN